MITVVAALIQQDGRLLICQRRKSDSCALKWEFPGGKVKPGESAEQGLRRELAEELGVTATVAQELHRARHRCAELDDEIQIVFFAATLGAEPARNLAFEQVLWAEPAALSQYDFLPADRELIAMLASGVLSLPC